jgi:cytochrome c-type biogenesis protein CcmH
VRFFLACLTLLIMMIAIAGISPIAIRAQGDLTPTLRPVTDNEVNRISKNLFCPVCENVPLDVCDTEACARWREQVRDLLAQGYSEKQIQQYFIDRFGAKTVGTPADAGTQFLTVILPMLLIGLIGMVAAVSLLRWRARNASANDNPVITNTPTTPSDDYRARLEAELKERD